LVSVPRVSLDGSRLPVLGGLKINGTEEGNVTDGPACLTCLAIAGLGIWFANVDSSWALIALGACLAMAAQWLSFGLHNYQAELYPTRIRARGVGFVYSWSRLSGILTPFFIAFFLRDFGPNGVFAFVAGCMAIVILSVATLGPRTNLLEVEAIAH
jgi:MFS transporter, putative metabolite:H+ symporter